MNIYEPIGAPNYELIHVSSSEEYAILADFDGTPRADTWRPVHVQRVDYEEHKKSYPSDFPWLGSDVLILRGHTVMALRDLLDAYGELLPLATDDTVKLYALNAWAVDALDESRSSLMRFPSSGRIMHIQKPVFFPEKVRDRLLFRLPGRAMPTYVSEAFVERIQQAGLVGLDFDLVATVP